MAKLHNYNGRYCETEYENAFLSFLEEAGWSYLPGSSLPRTSMRDVLYVDDMEYFLNKTNPDLTADEIQQIMDTVRLAGAESDFATLHKVYGWMVNGIQFTPQSGLPIMVNLIDFENPEKNVFRAVNQFIVEYTNNGQTENRRPDILLFVNGIPLCIVELKNPADGNATIYGAWEQINLRYWRDIPHLLHYCPLACISDGVKTRLGTVRTPYEHFYAWRRVNDGDKVSPLPFDEVQTMIKGVYSPKRFLEIFRDYIYFQDSEYDSEEREIVCRYPQFFATRLLKQSIIKSVVEMLEETIQHYHERRKHLATEEAGEAQEQTSEEIIRNATEQALRILHEMNEDHESFRKIGLTFEEKAFYDILMTLRNEYNFECGKDKIVDGVSVNEKCRSLAKKIKKIIDTKSSFADWLNNQNVRDQLKFDIKVCLIKNGYPPQYSPEVFRKVMEQVENFAEHNV